LSYEAIRDCTCQLTDPWRLLQMHFTAMKSIQWIRFKSLLEPKNGLEKFIAKQRMGKTNNGLASLTGGENRRIWTWRAFVKLLSIYAEQQRKG
jgi:hypothetical protein